MKVPAWKGLTTHHYRVFRQYRNRSYLQIRPIYALFHRSFHKNKKGVNMALIKCHECGKQISDSASSCPGCGAPVRARTVKRGDYLQYTDREVSILLSKKKQTNHILHLLLSVITAGFWVFIWIIVAAINGSFNAKIDKEIQEGRKV